jgi:hypothetical protein
VYRTAKHTCSQLSEQIRIRLELVDAIVRCQREQRIRICVPPRIIRVLQRILLYTVLPIPLARRRLTELILNGVFDIES